MLMETYVCVDDHQIVIDWFSTLKKKSISMTFGILSSSCLPRQGYPFFNCLQSFKLNFSNRLWAGDLICFVLNDLDI